MGMYHQKFEKLFPDGMERESECYAEYVKANPEERDKIKKIYRKLEKKILQYTRKAQIIEDNNPKIDLDGDVYGLRDRITKYNRKEFLEAAERAQNEIEFIKNFFLVYLGEQFDTEPAVE
jgi:hypothetical protein